MCRFSSLISPTGLTSLAIFSILVVGGITVVEHDNGSESASHQNTSPPQQSARAPHDNPAQVPVSMIDLDGATGDYAQLQALGEDIADFTGQDNLWPSIYIEDLDTHHAVQIGENAHHNAKSLMKVPLVIDAFKAAEQGKLDLDAPVELQADQLDKAYGDLWRKGAGYKLTLRQAAQLALQKSDNTAIRLINAHVFAVVPSQDRTHRILNVPVEVESDGDALINSQDYATFLRCLYQACHVSRQHSDEILQLLKGSDFKNAGSKLPDGTPVAHKIGNVNDPLGADNTYIGYNDCGIVYGPEKPFIFCIMLGVPRTQADPIIAEIIKRAYDYLEK